MPQSAANSTCNACCVASLYPEGRCPVIVWLMSQMESCQRTATLLCISVVLLFGGCRQPLNPQKRLRLSYDPDKRAHHLRILREGLAGASGEDALLIKLRLAELTGGPDAIELFEQCRDESPDLAFAAHYGLYLASIPLLTNQAAILNSWIKDDPDNALPCYLLAQLQFRNRVNADAALELLQRGNQLASAAFHPVYQLPQVHEFLDLTTAQRDLAEGEFLLRAATIRSKLLDLSRRASEAVSSAQYLDIPQGSQDLVRCGDRIACSTPSSAVHFGIGCEMSRLAMDRLLNVDGLPEKVQHDLVALRAERQKEYALVLDDALHAVDVGGRHEAEIVQRACARIHQSTGTKASGRGRPESAD